MTSYTLIGQVELVFNVAVDTEGSQMRPFQRESAGGKVIEFHSLPAGLVMANFAIGGKSQFCVSRFYRCLEILFMTAKTKCLCSAIVVGMARNAISLLMRPA